MDIAPAHPNQAEALTRVSVAAKAFWGYDLQALFGWANELTISAEPIRCCPTYAARQRASRGFLPIFLGSTLARLEHLWVLPGHMRSGIGRALLQHATKTAGTTLTFLDLLMPTRMRRRSILLAECVRSGAGRADSGPARAIPGADGIAVCSRLKSGRRPAGGPQLAASRTWDDQEA